jgi:hypothetical protein
LPAEEQVVTVTMDNGWSKAIGVGKLREGDGRAVVVDMDPAADPVLFWAGKRNRREVPVLPLQRNEIVSESRIAQIIERARRAAEEKSDAARQGHLFADLEKTLRESDRSKRVEFYTHEQGWKNKLICGDSLHVMESLLHYENLRGKVQMIYIDPPYGIKYDSNFQQRVDSTKNEEKDEADDVLTIRAFRDTWALGIHSYLGYLQERLYLCRDPKGTCDAPWDLMHGCSTLFRVPLTPRSPPRLRLLPFAPVDWVDIVDAAPIPAGVNFGATRHRQVIEQGGQGAFRTVHSQ